MGSRRDNGHKVQSAIIDISLTRKSGQSVMLALDLVSVDTSVDHRDIDSGDALTQPEFLHDSRIGLTAMKTHHLREQCSADVDVTH